VMQIAAQQGLAHFAEAIPRRLIAAID